ncbi:MAG: 30S ribosomal protein S16 [Methylacidiphilales bacterium]|nr:30S ribosomal protein S16 [Candidatus Methylacidiphilales bacterium]
MVKVRLSRWGKKNRAFYKIVVTDHRRPRDSGYIESIGYYNPYATESEQLLQLDQEKLDYWKGKGAQVSSRLKALLKKKAS